MSTPNFAMLILTHGRPNKVTTLDTLRRCGYTGKVFIIIDDEDSTADQYRKTFGSDKVIQFNKSEIAKTFDTCDTSKDKRAIVYARNAAFQIAKDLELDYFMQLDDDYLSFQYRYPQGNKLKVVESRSMDAVVAAMIQFLETSGAATFAMAQGGDFIGGVQGNAAHKPLLRKAMNSFLFKTDTPTRFVGRVNEDVNTYVINGMRGDLFLTTTAIMLVQQQTQKNSGGMTDLYLESGTYLKSFYTVLQAPSCTTIRTMGTNHLRLHHHIRWDHAVPKILNEKHRRA